LYESGQLIKRSGVLDEEQLNWIMIYEDRNFAPITNEEPEAPAEEPSTEGGDEESEEEPVE